MLTELILRVDWTDGGQPLAGVVIQKSLGSKERAWIELFLAASSPVIQGLADRIYR
jgi:hypothetical protein